MPTKTAPKKAAPKKAAPKQAEVVAEMPTPAEPDLLEKVFALGDDLEAHVGDFKEPVLTHLNGIRSSIEGLRNSLVTAAGRERPDDSWKAFR